MSIEEVLEKYFEISMPENSKIAGYKNNFQEDTYLGNIVIVLKLDSEDKEEFIQSIEENYSEPLMLEEESLHEFYEKYTSVWIKEYENNIKDLVTDYSQKAYEIESIYHMVSSEAFYEEKGGRKTVERGLFITNDYDGTFNVYLEY